MFNTKDIFIPFYFTKCEEAGNSTSANVNQLPGMALHPLRRCGDLLILRVELSILMGEKIPATSGARTCNL